MARRRFNFLKNLIPEPRGFDDPVKRTCAHAERRWETAAGGFTLTSASFAAALAAGLAVPPLAPFLGVAAAASGLLKMSAKRGKEDPPRPDYEAPVLPPSPQIDFLLLEPQSVPLEFLQLVRAVEMSGRYLSATVEALEKSLGAAGDAEVGIEEAQHFAERRFREARRNALLTSYVLRSTASLSGPLGQGLERWLPEIPTDHRDVTTILEAVGTAEGAGRLLAAGVDLELLAEPLSLEFDDLSLQTLGQVISEGGAATASLADELERWATDEPEPDREFGPSQPIPPSWEPSQARDSVSGEGEGLAEAT